MRTSSVGFKIAGVDDPMSRKPCGALSYWSIVSIRKTDHISVYRSFSRHGGHIVSQLPEFLERYFWEIDFAGLRFPEHQSYVIERVLEYGDDHAIRWLKATFSPKTIAAVVRDSRRISKNTANLWALVLEIPKEQIRCFSTPSLPTPGNS
jgi:hypothetical protein